MKNNQESRKGLNPIGLVLAVYVLAVLIVSASTGHLAHVGDDQLLLYMSDSKGYIALANYYTLGDEVAPSAALIQLRPFVYPCFLGLQRLIGTAAFQILQIILNLLTLFLLYQTALLVSHRRWFATVCAGLLAATPTFTFIAFHALSDALGVFLCTLFLYFACQAYLRKSTMSLPLIGLILGVLVCVKPVVLSFFLVFGIISAVRLLRSQAIKQLAYFVVLLAAPLLVQLLITGILTGDPVLSTAGSVNLNHRFFPAVYGYAEHDRFLSYSTPEAATARSSYPTEGSQLQYLVCHPVATLRATSHILINEHLLAASEYVFSPRDPQQPPAPASNLMRKLSRRMNRLFLAFHLTFVVVIAYVRLFRGKRFGYSRPAVILYLFALSILVPSVLTYWQGDRLILLAQPVWLLAYVFLVTGLLDRRKGLIEAASFEDKTKPA